MNPILKWPGGKRNLAERVRRCFDASPKSYYHEPFCGSLAVYLHRLEMRDVIPSKTVLSDASPKLIDFYRLIAGAPATVIAELKKLPTGPGWRTEFSGIRDQLNNEMDPEHPAFAARFLWYNKACFNGLMRVNQDGFYNAPVGNYETVVLPPPDEIIAFSDAIDNVEFVCELYSETMGRIGDNDQAYLDPPYHHQFSGYTCEGFTWEDQVNVASGAERARRHGAKVVISNAGTPEIRSLYGAFRWSIVDVEADRSISCKGDGRGKQTEILAVCDRRRKA